MINHILVPLDSSTLAECVLPHVMAIAPAMNARVTLLHVLENPRNGNGAPAVDPVDWHLRKHKSERYLEQIAERLQNSGLNAEYSILEGNPAQGIIEFARNNGVDLIALSTHGNSGLSGWNVSSVVQKILLRSYKSTLLIRAYLPTVAASSKVRYKRLFVGLDGSTRSEYVLPVAMRLAQAYKSELQLGTVIQKPQIIHRFPLSEKDSKLINQIVDMNQKAASHYLDQLLTQFSLEGLDLKTDIVVGDNPIADLHDMVDEIKADMVMLVAHGHSGERRWPYGSVTNSFLAYGNTPLMIMQDLSESEIPHTYAELAMKEGNKGH
ncbi:MAG TPA: universal stress protein [Anaerolineales bacterium]|nr:universal stress protein [Anaerolineales bacterium]